MIKILMVITFLFSCSFRPEEKKRPPGKEQLKLESNPPLDSDGDGITDEDEIKTGTDPFLADIPTFEGDFFKELNVDIELYNKVSRSYENLKWETRNGKTKLSWENKGRQSPQGGLYMESLLKNYATNFNFKKNNFRFFDYNEGIFSYASPIFYEDTLFSISNRLLELRRKGFEINGAEAVILSKFKIRSNKYQSFRNPVFDIYYKSKDRESLIFIESKRIEGTYSFNEENEVYVHFENDDAKIINESLLSGGASFFLKLRDFTVYDTDENYSSILEKVQSKSVPVTITYTNEEKSENSRVETLYVGINGDPTSLRDILRIGLQDSILMTDSNIDQVRGLSNRQRSYNESGQNESLKWYVGSGHIGDNIYSYLFKPNEGIGLAYISDKKIERKPIFVARSILRNGITSHSGKLPEETKNLKIRIRPLKVLTPVENYEKITLPNCGVGRWDTNQVFYNRVILGWADRTNHLIPSLVQDGYLKISSSRDSIIEGSLQKLINGGLIAITKVEGSKDIEISLLPQVTSELAKKSSPISAELYLIPSQVNINVGHLIQTGKNCQHRESPEPPRGVDGGRGGGNRPTSKMNHTGMGYGTEASEIQYDLDIHIFAF